jgi:hypothetical protein
MVSRNATTHGLTAARVLPEEQEEFDRFATALSYEWQSESPLEQLRNRMIGQMIRAFGADDVVALHPG